MFLNILLPSNNLTFNLQINVETLDFVNNIIL